MNDESFATMTIDGVPVPVMNLHFEPVPVPAVTCAASTGEYTARVTLEGTCWRRFRLDMSRKLIAQGVKTNRTVRRMLRRDWRYLQGWHGRWQWEADAEALRQNLVTRLLRDYDNEEVPNG